MSGRKGKGGNRSWTGIVLPGAGKAETGVGRELSCREPVRQRQERDGNCPAGKGKAEIGNELSEPELAPEKQIQDRNRRNLSNGKNCTDYRGSKRYRAADRH